MGVVSVSLCCNNPDNGMFNGRFSNVEIGDNLLSLDNKYYPPREPKLDYRFETEGNNGFAADTAIGHIKVSHRNFPIIGYKYGWGNWCWSLVLVTPEVAIDLINYLQHLDHWTSEGDTEFCDHYDTGKRFEKSEKWLKLLGKYGYQRP
jgi:hypothetical protein